VGQTVDPFGALYSFQGKQRGAVHPLPRTKHINAATALAACNISIHYIHSKDPPVGMPTKANPVRVLQ
jgi:hypothetical protein